MPVLYDGVLPNLPIIKPTKDEVHNCRRIQLRSRYPWDTFPLGGIVSRMESLTGYIDVE